MVSIGASLLYKPKDCEVGDCKDGAGGEETIRSEKEEGSVSAREEKKKDLRVTKINMRTMEMFTPQLRILTKAQLSDYN